MPFCASEQALEYKKTLLQLKIQFLYDKCQILRYLIYEKCGGIFLQAVPNPEKWWWWWGDIFPILRDLRQWPRKPVTAT